jgi:hypothetical protein
MGAGGADPVTGKTEHTAGAAAPGAPRSLMGKGRGQTGGYAGASVSSHPGRRGLNLPSLDGDGPCSRSPLILNVKHNGPPGLVN